MKPAMAMSRAAGQQVPITYEYEIRSERPFHQSYRPRLGFIGVGRIGLRRLEAISNTNSADVVVIADSDADIASLALSCAPDALLVNSMDRLLRAGVDGVVIATPSALHAQQAIATLERRIPVFCQNPLGTSSAETRRVVQAARSADRLLAVDTLYRNTSAMHEIKELIYTNRLGDLNEVNLVCHGSGECHKTMANDHRLSKGECLLEQGQPLLDLALWAMGCPRVTAVSGCLWSGGKPFRRSDGGVEDSAAVQLELENGVTMRLSCS